MNLYLSLFFTFARIGLFTFGGGYAMISMIENLCIEEKKWISHDELMDILVIAESTPGPIALNCATFVGYKKKGFAGALLATLGLVLPSFVIIFIISVFLDNFLEITVISNAFKGIKVAVGILISDAGFTMFRKMKKKKPLQITIMICAFVSMLIINLFSLNFSSIALMLIAATVGLLAFLIKGNTTEKGGNNDIS